MRKPETIKALEEFGRERLSQSFFMREFLYSEISQIEKIPNLPDDPELAITAGKHLCQQVLEPIQEAWGRISIRSAFRSCEVNQKGLETGNNCAKNENNYAYHIWDKKDKDDFMGATACIIVTSFIPYYEETGDWTALAWWIHDHVPAYANMTFFPKYAAFNISWHENPNYPKYIDSYVQDPHSGKSKGYLTKPGMDNFAGTHEAFYKDALRFASPNVRSRYF
ncbi:MAG TPA: hypothetical protein V6D19_05140 [Stenomitos sp.]